MPQNHTGTAHNVQPVQRPHLFGMQVRINVSVVQHPTMQHHIGMEHNVSVVIRQIVLNHIGTVALVQRVRHQHQFGVPAKTNVSAVQLPTVQHHTGMAQSASVVIRQITLNHIGTVALVQRVRLKHRSGIHLKMYAKLVKFVRMMKIILMRQHYFLLYIYHIIAYVLNGGIQYRPVV